MLSEMGAPSGTLNVVCANPNDVLDHWLDSDDVDDLMFFGDIRSRYRDRQPMDEPRQESHP